MKKIKEISSASTEQLLRLSLELSESFEEVIILSSNDYEDTYGKYEFLAAFGAYRKLVASESAFSQLAKFNEEGSWLFGHLSYELKDEIENSKSRHKNLFDFPLLQFFEPKHLLVWRRGSKNAEWLSHDEAEFDKMQTKLGSNAPNTYDRKLYYSPTLSKEEYIRRVNALKEEIKYGNIYEVNYCQQFVAKGSIDPQLEFTQLNTGSSMPFSAFYKTANNYLLCASPERFMTKRGEKLICQPIKGTARRSPDLDEDERIKNELKNDLKEQTENVMIVDLMRNDLSRTADRNSVKVEELFGVYSFPQVHQLISTVSSRLDENFSSIDAIKAAFPMGSMTGAPKIKAMELIDQWETAARELYSGSVGYFDPDGDFDLNVVIRSILFNANNETCSYTAGGAITDLASAEAEYEECLLKAKAIFEHKEVSANE